MKSLETAKSTLEELLGSMGFVSVIEYNESENILDITTDNQALLIGKKGENLRALQFIFNSILHKKTDSQDFYVLDVSGYKKDRIKKVARIAEEAAAEVLAYNVTKTLPAMNAFERRQVHMVLADQPDLVTESIGFEPNRQIVIKKR